MNVHNAEDMKPVTNTSDKRLDDKLKVVKSDADHPLHGLLATMKASVQHLEGSWQFQIFNNIDEIHNCLKDKLSQQELAVFVEQLELLVKKPLRRQMGRIKAISRSIDELYRYLS